MARSEKFANFDCVVFSAAMATALLLSPAAIQAGGLDISRQSVDAGSVPVGDLSAPLNVTVINNIGQNFTFYSTYFVPTDPGAPEYKRTTIKFDGDAVARTNGEDGCGKTRGSWVLQAGSSCVLTFYYLPTRAGPSSGHVYLDDADGAHLANISVTGTGIEQGYLGSAILPAGINPDYSGTVMDTDYIAPPGCSGAAVNDAEVLQNRLDNASEGEVICIQAGVTLTRATGWMLKNRGEWSNYTYVITSDYASLPPPGTRTGPADSARMPQLRTSGGRPMIQAEKGANHYRLVGLDMAPSSVVYGQWGAVYLESYGNPPLTEAEYAHHIIIDRSYVHWLPGDHDAPGGIRINANYAAVIDSYVAIDDSSEAQAISGGNGGPVKIVNNFLQAAGENIIFGGSDSSVLGAYGHDIEIRNNHLYKPMEWNPNCAGASNPCGAAFDGVRRTVKNLFELKKARRVLAIGNVMENNWISGQDGSAVLIQPANQAGSDVTSTVRDLTFVYNIVRGSTNAFNVVGTSYGWPSQQAQRLVFMHNLAFDLGGPKWGGVNAKCIVNMAASRSGAPITKSRNFIPIHELGFIHNDCLDTLGLVINVPSQIGGETVGVHVDGMKFKDNLLWHGVYGIMFSGTPGDKCCGSSNNLQNAWNPADYAKNGLVGPIGADNYYSSQYSPANFVQTADLASVKFADYAGRDFHLAADSPFHGQASDGTDLGADIGRVDAATAGVVEGAPGAHPPAEPAPPSISSFTADPSVVYAGQPVALSWLVSGAPAPSVIIDNGVGELTGLSACTAYPRSNTTYTLTAANEAGTAAKNVSVIVLPWRQRRIIITLEGAARAVNGRLSFLDINSGAALNFTDFAADMLGQALVAIPPMQAADLKIAIPGYLPALIKNHDMTSESTTNVSASLLAGNLNGDGVVNSLDFSLMSSHWNESYDLGDFDSDGIANAGDLHFVMKNWHAGGG